ncbi:MAG: polysaccharide biosynthesis C-terminal domain-containing protein [Bacilli bacterium]|nr:polysaccharide biosynthesis C-terminal domain-containing protein [Bacilli bacterium]
MVALSEHFNFKKIFKIVAAPIAMMVFTSLYTIVDGFFVSSVAGTDAFSGLNLIFPYYAVFSCVGFMFGSGGAALVGKIRGEGDGVKADRYFSLIVYTTIAVGFILGVIMYFTTEPVAIALARISSENSEKMVEAAITYGKTMSLGMVFICLQYLFQPFFNVAERPGTCFFFMLTAGLSNVLFDYIYIVVARLGINGAALATIQGQFIAGVIPIFYFIFNKRLPIHIGKTRFEIKPLLQTCYNGMSEFVSQIASAVLGFVYNMQLLKYAGPTGVAAYGVMLYLNFVFMAIFIGYSMGVAPIIAYNYGAKNPKEISNIWKKSLILIGITGIVMFAISIIGSDLLASLFSNGNQEMHRITTNGIRIFSFIYLTAGFSIFASNFYTSLNNGTISAIISLVRVAIFEVSAVLLLPLLWNVNGIWAAGPFAEIGSTIVTIFFFIKMRKRYQY